MSNPTLISENEESQAGQFQESPGNQRLGDTECPILFPPSLSSQTAFKVLGITGANAGSYLNTLGYVSGQEDWTLDLDSLPLATMGVGRSGSPGAPNNYVTGSPGYYFDKGIWEFTFTFSASSAYDNDGNIFDTYTNLAGGGFVNITGLDYNNVSPGTIISFQMKAPVEQPSGHFAYADNSPQVFTYTYKSLCFFSLGLSYTQNNSSNGIPPFGPSNNISASSTLASLVWSARKIADNTTSDSAITSDSNQQI